MLQRQRQVTVFPAVAVEQQRSVYETAFLRTVLSLHGAGVAPSPLQMAQATKVLRLYGLRVAIRDFYAAQPVANTLPARLARFAGVEDAFVFVRCNSVLPPDAAQVQAMYEWLALRIQQ